VWGTSHSVFHCGILYRQKHAKDKFAPDPNQVPCHEDIGGMEV